MPALNKDSKSDSNALQRDAAGSDEALKLLLLYIKYEERNLHDCLARTDQTKAKIAIAQQKLLDAKATHLEAQKIDIRATQRHEGIAKQHAKVFPTTLDQRIDKFCGKTKGEFQRTSLTLENICPSIKQLILKCKSGAFRSHQQKISARKSRIDRLRKEANFLEEAKSAKTLSARGVENEIKKSIDYIVDHAFNATSKKLVKDWDIIIGKKPPPVFNLDDDDDTQSLQDSDASVILLSSDDEIQVVKTMLKAKKPPTKKRRAVTRSLRSSSCASSNDDALDVYKQVEAILKPFYNCCPPIVNCKIIAL